MEKQNTLAIYKYELFVLFLFSGFAVVSSISLLMSELHYLQDPSKALACDFNPLIGCSSSLTSWQAHLFFSIPNSVVGLCAFMVFLSLSGLMLCKIDLPKWVINTMYAGINLALIWVFWFLWVSVFDFKKLCPFCLVIWFSVIIIWATMTGIVFRNGFISKSKSVNMILGSYRFYFAIIIVLCIVIFIIFGMLDTWIIVLDS
ncbi:hypothetical protein HCQ94_04380 [Actinomyces sp. zg-332]|uniref:vitamin K epoxide reductase family protein n=1 Tax=Actinomyces sp. zg-332 TaxID=2708340 RepID=UPI00141E7561|nr:vitamin K epoxide reductase family protein [Actinomyces sp. zg-332]QPK93829.1 hypothetical protein HCQ94_04380 [Actinomyces sp. zg-332]